MARVIPVTEMNVSRSSGVYAIVNTTNKKVYVGSAKVLVTRWKEHIYRLNKNKHHCQYLQNAWNKTENSFKFIVLELVPKEQLLSCEQKWLDVLHDNQNNCYNVLKMARSRLGIPHTEETKRKMSLANKRLPQTEENKAKARERGKLQTDLHFKPGKLHVFYGQGNKHVACKTVEQRDKTTGVVVATFCSFGEAQEKTGISRYNISEVTSGHRPFAGGFVWTVVEKNKKEGQNG